MKKISVNKSLIAPCGMDCALCYGYQREKNRCGGCRSRYGDKELAEVRCIIVKCPEKKDRFDFCHDCRKFPCRRIKQLDERYRKKYFMSMTENLEYIRKNGINAFIGMERERRKCSNCGEIVCVHKGKCLSCGKSIS